MKTKRKLRWLTVCAVAALTVAVVVLVVATSIAQEGNPAPPDHGVFPSKQGLPPVEESDLEALFGLDGTVGKVMQLPAAAFRSNGRSPDKFRNTYAGYFYGTADCEAYLLLPIVFPEGATRIKSIRVYVHDANPGQSEGFWLNRVAPTTGAYEELGYFNTSDSTGIEAYKMPISKKALSNFRAYYIRTYAYTGIYVYGVRVVYE